MKIAAGWPGRNRPHLRWTRVSQDLRGWFLLRRWSLASQEKIGSCSLRLETNISTSKSTSRCSLQGSWEKCIYIRIDLALLASQDWREMYLHPNWPRAAHFARLKWNVSTSKLTSRCALREGWEEWVIFDWTLCCSLRWSGCGSVSGSTPCYALCLFSRTRISFRTVRCGRFRPGDPAAIFIPQREWRIFHYLHRS